MSEMTPALAGKMTVEVILIVLAMIGLAVVVGEFMGWLGSKYPKLSATHEEYYGGSYETKDDDAQDYEEGTEAPREIAS